jgi:glycosyltransferase involved in cell wall biosynthesis
MNLLQTEYNINNIVQIVPGVDLQEFGFRGTGNSLVGKRKLVVGFVGRNYSSTSRKNSELLKKIGKLPFVELRVTGGKMPEHKVPEFYKNADLIISPSIIEGGSMAILESAAVGVPFVCFADVGMADEFADVINRIPRTGIIEKDNEAFVQFLKDVWANKKIPMDDALAMRRKVAQFTWKNFVESHDKVWERIVNESGLKKI